MPICIGATPANTSGYSRLVAVRPLNLQVSQLSSNNSSVIISTVRSSSSYLTHSAIAIMANTTGTSQNPIPVATQASQQIPQASQSQLARASSVSLAISNLGGPPQPKAVRRHLPIPPSNFSKLPLDLGVSRVGPPKPDDPIQTELQQHMLDSFRAFGRWGLVLAIYREALQPKNSSNASWKYLTDDVEGGNQYMYRLSMLLSDSVIESLIKNTLPYDYFRDQKVKDFVNGNMSIESAPCPGIYLNIVTRAARQVGLKTVTPGNPSLRGEWLTSSEVEEMLVRVGGYLDNNQADVRENADIENWLKAAPGIAKVHEERKWAGKTATHIQPWKEWRQAIRRQYRTNIAPGDVDSRFIRCPCEVGWSENIPRRCLDHVNNASTTPIFGVVNSITRQSRTHGGFDFPKPWQLTLFPVWEREQKLAQVAEAFGTVLCSSYWQWGGMNIHEAGFSTITTKTPQYSDSLWTHGIRATLKRLEQVKAVDAEVQNATDRDEIFTMVYELEDLEQQIIEAREKEEDVSKLRGNNKKIIAELGAGYAKDRADADTQRNTNAENRDRVDSHTKSILGHFKSGMDFVKAREKKRKEAYAELEK